MSKDQAVVAGEAKRNLGLYTQCQKCFGDKLEGGLECGECYRGFVATDFSEQNLRDLVYLKKLDTLRQEAGITAAMLRDGRAKEMADLYRGKKEE